MPRPQPDPDVAQAFSQELARTADWLRTIPLARLDPVADRAHEVSQQLAGLAESLRGVAQAPIVPRLRPHASGDQIAVLGHDLLAAARQAESDGRAGPGDQVAAALRAGADVLRELRGAGPLPFGSRPVDEAGHDESGHDESGRDHAGAAARSGPGRHA